MLEQLRGSTGWTPGTERDLLLSFLEEHAPPAVRDDARRYLAHVAQHPDHPFMDETPAARELRGVAQRRAMTATNLVAAQRLDLRGLSLDALRNLNVVLRHLEDKVHDLETKVRQPWRRGGY